MNQILELKRQSFPQPDGSELQAAFMACNVYDLNAADEFVNEVANHVRTDLMLHPQTTHLLITIVGDLSAAAFAKLWHARLTGDTLLRAYVVKLMKASVVWGSSEGKSLAEESLSPL